MQGLYFEARDKCMFEWFAPLVLNCFLTNLDVAMNLNCMNARHSLVTWLAKILAVTFHCLIFLNSNFMFISSWYKVKTFLLVMQRFGNLKVGSVFGFLHPKTAVSISVSIFKKKSVFLF